MHIDGFTKNDYVLALSLGGITYDDKIKERLKFYSLAETTYTLLYHNLNKYVDKVHEVKEVHDKLGIFSIDIYHSSYPKLLKYISNPPFVLFGKGNISLLEKPSVSMVGTRQPSGISLRCASFVTEYLSKCNITIVSGMALGIDSICHRTAYKNKGGTIGILAHGLDWVYPKANYDLFALAKSKQTDSVLLLTEYCAGIRPQRYTFPKRNRIISALSHATLLLECGVKSGALLTAQSALQQGRDVWVFDHELSQNNEGGKKLLYDGAIPLSNFIQITHKHNNQQDKKLLDALTSHSTYYLGNHMWIECQIISEQTWLDSLFFTV